jgi:hypothetical protein
MASKNFWHNPNMNQLIQYYKQFFDISGTSSYPNIKQNIKSLECDEAGNLLAKQLHKLSKAIINQNAYGYAKDDETYLHDIQQYMWTMMMVKYDPIKSPNSFAYLYRCGLNRLKTMLWSQKSASFGLYDAPTTTSHTVRIPYESIQGDVDKFIEDFVADTEAGSHNVSVTSRKYKHSVTFKIKYTGRLHTQIEATDDIQDISHIRELADVIDWQILSEYIPDVELTEYHKKLCYVYLDAIKTIVETPTLLRKGRAAIYIVYEMVRSRTGTYVRAFDLQMCKAGLTEAFRYYAEDFLQNIEPIYGDNGYIAYQT